VVTPERPRSRPAAAARPSARGPLTSRAARAILLTILSEHVHGRREEVWQETLINALVGVGHSEQAARQAVARSIRHGLLHSRRVARRARMSLTPYAREILASGRQRIGAFEANGSWDGRWLVLVMRVPEEHRQVRHQVRSALARAGMGTLGGGVWITPHAERESLVAKALSAVDDAADAISFHATLGAMGGREVIAGAWQVEAVAHRYREFLATFGRARPSTPAAIFSARTRLLHAWRRLALEDPNLPEQVLPAAWPRARAQALEERREREWRAEAEAFFASLEERIDGATDAPQCAG
jgi:phenylacetic acid degradation operon negative regulatory protein